MNSKKYKYTSYNATFKPHRYTVFSAYRYTVNMNDCSSSPVPRPDFYDRKS